MLNCYMLALLEAIPVQHLFKYIFNMRTIQGIDGIQNLGDWKAIAIVLVTLCIEGFETIKILE